MKNLNLFTSFLCIIFFLTFSLFNISFYLIKKKTYFKDQLNIEFTIGCNEENFNEYKINICPLLLNEIYSDFKNTSLSIMQDTATFQEILPKTDIRKKSVYFYDHTGKVYFKDNYSYKENLFYEVNKTNTYYFETIFVIDKTENSNETINNLSILIEQLKNKHLKNLININNITLLYQTKYNLKYILSDTEQQSRSILNFYLANKEKIILIDKKIKEIRVQVKNYHPKFDGLSYLSINFSAFLIFLLFYCLLKIIFKRVKL
jgi:hypothetical protein